MHYTFSNSTIVDLNDVSATVYDEDGGGKIRIVRKGDQPDIVIPASRDDFVDLQKAITVWVSTTMGVAPVSPSRGINEALARAVVSFMNEVITVDPVALDGLMRHRVPCNEAMANHPTIQVRSYGPDPRPNVSFLGLLNGLCGSDENQIGGVSMHMDDKKEHVLRFVFNDAEKRKKYL